MKQFSKSVLMWSVIVFSISLFWPEKGFPDNRLRFREEARQTAFVSKANKQSIVMGQFENVQEEIVEIVQENGLIFFEQMDQLAKVQGDLGRLIRDHAALRFQTAQEIEKIRSELEMMMAENTLFQVEVSQEIGKGQADVGKAILLAQRAAPGTKAFRAAQERLGKVIRDNAILHSEIAVRIGVNQERLGTAIRDHARYLVQTAKKIGRGEERLARVILSQAQTLQAANQSMVSGQKRLGTAIQEGSSDQRKLLAQFEILQ